LDPLAAKKKWIMDQERSFAWDLAHRVIDTPRLNMWMILIPLILVYHNRSNCLIILNQLNQLEKALNSALNDGLAETIADVAKTIQRIEAATTELRRLQAETFFP
jgi:hypothetical protein